MRSYFVMVTSDNGDTYEFTSECYLSESDQLLLKKYVAKTYYENSFETDEDIDEYFFIDIYDLEKTKRFEDCLEKDTKF